MAYRQEHALLDDEIAQLIDSSVSTSASSNASLEIVFDGDLFDFDAPHLHAISSTTLQVSISHDEAGAASLIAAILKDHPAFVSAVGRAVRAGAKAVFVPGNHDAQIAFPAVRRVITNAIMAVAQANPQLIVFRSWFHRTPDGLHIEHGHLYDPLCVLENVLPTLEDGRLSMEDTVGTVSSFYVPQLLGCLNPHDADPLDTSIEELLDATQRCAIGDLRTGLYPQIAAELLQRFSRIQNGQASGVETLCQAAFAETGVDLITLRRHAALFAPKSSVADFIATGRWKFYVPDTDRKLRAAATQIARIHSPIGVVMGHTHRAYGEWVEGRFFGNDGTWAPTKDDSSGSFVWISYTDGNVSGGTFTSQRS